MNTKRTCTVALGLLLILAISGGCGSAEKPSKRALAKAINAHLEENPTHLSYKVATGPLDWVKGDAGKPSSLTALVEAGYLEDTRNPLYAYQVLKPGQDVLEKDVMDGDIRLRFAVADGDAEVVRFTVPQPDDGLLTTQVEYEVEWQPSRLMTDRKLARFREALAQDLPKIKADMEKPIRRTALMVLYNDGWHVERDYNN